MRRPILIFVMLAFISGCTRYDRPKDIVVKVNSYEISRAEFEQEFKDSSFGREDTAQSRREFLNNLIERILIVQDAQKSGLENDPQFLKMVEKFWIQSLLKLALEKKTKDFAGVSFVSDKAIEEAYQLMLKEGKTTKPPEEMYQQIKWSLMMAKESQMMNDWLGQLHENADIRINKDLILKDK